MTVQRCQSAQRAGDQSKPDVVDRCAAIASGGSEVGERSAALDRGLKAARTIQAAAWFSRATLCRTGRGAERDARRRLGDQGLAPGVRRVRVAVQHERGPAGRSLKSLRPKTEP